MNNSDFNKSLLKSDEVTKEDLMRLGEEYGIEFPKRISKEKVILKLLENELQDRIKEEFKEFITFPNWIIADYYEINTDDIERLEKCGFFNEGFKEKEFYSPTHKQYYSTKCYYESAFKYNKDEIKKLLNDLKGTGYRIRLETTTTEEINIVTDRLKDIFEISKIDTYEKRNEGYFSYMDITIVSDTEYKKNELLVEIKKLENKKNEIKSDRNETISKLREKTIQLRNASSNIENLEDKLKRTKERHMEIIKEFENQISEIKSKKNYGNSVLEKTNKIISDKAKALDELLAQELRENRELKDKLNKLEKENEELKEKLECHKGKNKGGRKKKFTDMEKETIKIYRLQDKSIREIAKIMECSIGTIHSIVKEL